MVGSWHENANVHVPASSWFPLQQCYTVNRVSIEETNSSQGNPGGGWRWKTQRKLEKTGCGRERQINFVNIIKFCSSLLCSIKSQTITDELGRPFSIRRCRAWFEHYAGISKYFNIV